MYFFHWVNSWVLLISQMLWQGLTLVGAPDKRGQSSISGVWGSPWPKGTHCLSHLLTFYCIWSKPFPEKGLEPTEPLFQEKSVLFFSLREGLVKHGLVERGNAARGGWLFSNQWASRQCQMPPGPIKSTFCASTALPGLGRRGAKGGAGLLCGILIERRSNFSWEGPAWAKAGSCGGSSPDGRRPA